jgi:transcriptional regulator with XRE-family HTH domain
MEEFKQTELKSWRKKMGLSQQKFSQMAGISLITLAGLESGRKKPRAKTLALVIEAVKKVEASGAASGPAAEAAETKRPGRPPGRRGRPPKVRTEAEPAVPKRRGRPPKALAAAAPVKRGPGRRPAATVSAEEAGPIRLSNLDLELINRILNMTGVEKLDLLRRLT